MAERSPLVFAAASTGPRATRQSPRPTLSGPGVAQQTTRLAPKLDRVTSAFASGRLTTTASPSALPPEQVIVLEVAGELNDFAKAIKRVSGLEFLAEEAEDRVESDQLFKATDNVGKAHRYDRQLYLVASDARAWRGILSLWDRFKNQQAFDRGYAPFKHLFARCKDVRPWDDTDRLERSGAIDAWHEDFSGLTDELVPFEVEFWLRDDPARRTALVDQLRLELGQVGGQLGGHLVLKGAGYHGALGVAPARLLLEAADRKTVSWISTGGVRFFHATGQIAAPISSETAARSDLKIDTALPSGAPRLAVLDGLPLAGHAALASRLTVDDPDGLGETTTAQQRRHGTLTSSIVVHGDLNSASQPQSRPVYVRPILVPGPSWVQNPPETLPPNRLPVDVLNEAVTRLFEGEAPAAPSITAVVLAVGDRIHQFDRFVSPLARLVDWLSFKHGVLFLVSSGNHLPTFSLPADLGFEDPQELQHEVLRHLQRSASLRRLLSPGEAINALTVGAAHDDASPAHVDARVDPMVTSDLPNVLSAVGAGIRRSVKPDILLEGGRQLLDLQPVREGEPTREATVAVTEQGPGVRAAAPGARPGDLNHTVRAAGTSVAVAMAGYHAGHLASQLDQLRDVLGPDERGRLDPSLDAVLVKAALVHSARWGSARAFIDRAAEDVPIPPSRDNVSRLLGFGRATPSEALRNHDQRVTVLAADRIAGDAAHAYRFPLPASLAASTVRRRLTLTLAWLTPINPEHRNYRRAALRVDVGGQGVGTDDRDTDHNTGRRGTVQHEVLSGVRAVPYRSGTALELTVACRADAGALPGSVPYALIASLEVPQASALPIYAEVRQGLAVLAGRPVLIRSYGSG